MGRAVSIIENSGALRECLTGPGGDETTGAQANRGEPLALSVLIAWSVCAIALVLVFFPHPWSRLAPDPDSLMRLVQVRDLIAGQGWFDAVQHRMNPPEGMPMHWSRLVDAPIAAIVLAGSAIWGQSTGETIALFAWPLVLLGGYVFAAAASATSIGSKQAAFPAAILAILCIDGLTYFIPGRIDHHNVQLALVLAALACAARISRGAIYGVGAGVALAVMLAVGLETLPYAIILAAGIALWWATGRADPRGTIAFGLTFAGTLAILHAATIRVSGIAVCDTLSPAYLLPGMAGGIGLSILAQLAHGWDRGGRLMGLAGLSVMVILPAAALFPQCLAGPYSAVSEELQTLWLSGVAEAQTLINYGAVKPAEAFGKIGAPVLALIVGLNMARKKDRVHDQQRLGLWLALAATGVALALSFAQVRAAPFANVFAIPVLAAWIGQIRSASRPNSLRASGANSLRAGLILVAVWLAATPLTYYGVGFGLAGLAGKAQGEVSVRASDPASPDSALAAMPYVARECADRSATVDLAFIEPGRVMSTVFYGPNILAMSGHQVVSGPYHRGEAAILDTIGSMGGSDEQARTIMARRGIDYLVICPTSSETRDTIPEAPEGLLARLVRGDTISWLQPVPGNSALKIFRVML